MGQMGKLRYIGKTGLDHLKSWARDGVGVSESIDLGAQWENPNHKVYADPCSYCSPTPTCWPRAAMAVVANTIP